MAKKVRTFLRCVIVDPGSNEAVQAANKGQVEQMLERHDAHRRKIRKLRKVKTITDLDRVLAE